MEDRREKILTLIMKKGFMSISQLSTIFPDISSMTIRRDLDLLEQRGDIVRTKGGAKSIMHLSMQKEAAYNSREFENLDLKREIATKAIKFVEDNSCVFFDSGSTLMHLAKSVDAKDLFAVTSGPNVAMELMKNPSCDVSMLGGRLSRENISVAGLGAVKFLKGINIGTAIIAASGYSPEYGFTCGNYDECELKKAVIKSAGRVVVVMDSTKLGKNHPFTFSRASDIDIFITDSSCDKTALGEIRKSGAKII